MQWFHACMRLGAWRAGPIIAPAIFAAAAACDVPAVTCDGGIERDIENGVCVVDFQGCSDGVRYGLECFGGPATCECIEDGVVRESETFFSEDSPCAVDDEEELERIIEVGCGWRLEA